jgi:glycolate oxidase FAD binding subunit
VSEVVDAFAREVGETDPVVAVGGRTQWDVGGAPAAAAREVHPPGGIVEFEPAEMTVRVMAGTTVAALDAALAEAGQMAVFDAPHPEQATVGGVLAVGHSGIRRLRYGSIRETVLQVTYVDAQGRVVRAGGPTVKNVSGFDLCRLFVGSLGTFGFLAEVVLRSHPRPEVSRWFQGRVDPFDLRDRLYRPSSLLWDGDAAWLLLEGDPADVDAQAALADLAECGGPPPLPTGGRQSLRPGALRELSGRFVAEIGVGVVHRDEPAPVESTTIPASAQALGRTIKARLDPLGRMNPGRTVLEAVAA